MSISLKARTNTVGTVAISEFAPKAFPFAGGNFDIAVDEPLECSIVDIATGIETPRVITFYTNKLKNVYENSGIDPQYQAKSKQGVRFITKVSDILELESDSDSDYRVLLPIEAHTVVTIPLCDKITEAVILQQLMDAVAAGYEINGSSATSRALKLARGLMKPKM